MVCGVLHILTQWRDRSKFIFPEFSEAVCLICRRRTSAGVKFRCPSSKRVPGPRFDVHAPLVLDITSDDALCRALEILELRTIRHTFTDPHLPSEGNAGTVLVKLAKCIQLATVIFIAALVG